MPLSETEVDPDPIEQFARWYTAALAEAGDSPVRDGVAVATASPDGQPSVRMVLLKGYGPDGFVFFTNYSSAKGRDLEANPAAAMLFYWPPDRQVRVAGPVERVSRGESDAYWAGRPRGSRLSALASPQSQVVPGRAALEARVAELDALHPDEVPRPDHWGGYRLRPETVEFWCHRDDRLHDRLRYRRDGSAWRLERLAP